MHRSDLLDGSRPVIAIIGGGASGTLAAMYLLWHAAADSTPVRILLVDRFGRHGTGRAYSTTHPGHVLNSPVAAMSAVPGDAGHLARWAQAEGIENSGFLSRSDYGRYLRELLADAQRRARPVADLDCISSDVVSVEYVGGGCAGAGGAGSKSAGGERDGGQRPLRLQLASGGRIDADKAVLAIGGLPPAFPCAVSSGSSGSRYLCDPWAPGALDGAGDGSPVIVLGTGLTMIDVAIAVTDAHPDTVVHAVSRHALLPREHRLPPGTGRGWGPPAARHAQAWPGRTRHATALAGTALAGTALPGTALPGTALPGTALAGTALPAMGPDAGAADGDAMDGGAPGETMRLGELVRQVRAAVDQYPGDWRDIVDALRPQIPHLWQRLPAEDRSLFMRRFARYWEVHRHRMPPATARRIAELRAAGRLSVRPGRLVSVSDGPGGVRARIDQDGSIIDLSAGWLINATGAAGDVAGASDPLLRSLLDSGLARPDRLRLGVDANSGGAVVDASGTPSNAIFTLGPTLRGTRYETTAIPEIRDQAVALARHLIGATGAGARPGSAA